jgi:hypothetical protein
VVKPDCVADDRDREPVSGVAHDVDARLQQRDVCIRI